MVAEQRRHDREWLLARQAGRRVGVAIGTLFVERYSDEESVAQNLESRAGELQVATVRAGSELQSKLEQRGLRVTTLGSNQCPSLGDYADGVDTMDFLLTLPKPSSHA